MMRRWRGPGASGPWLVAAACCAVAPAFADPSVPCQQPPVLVLDPGHTPAHQGALGARGRYEVSYNDALSNQIAAALRAAGITVVLTRTPVQEISLDERAQLANAGRADLFLAIHHDSAQLRYLEKSEWNGLNAYRTTTPLSGYAIFVSRRNARFADSARLAELLGQQLRGLGRPPSHHHAEKIPGEGRELINAELGIFGFDDLVVLKKTLIPAVLLEVGVIVDLDDEAYVADPVHQAQMVRAVVSSVLGYCGSSAGNPP